MTQEAATVKFWSGGSLRIIDAPDRHAEITETLGNPTHSRCTGHPIPEKSGKYWENSIWLRKTDLPEQSEVHEHLEWIVEFAQPHEAYLRKLIADGAQIDAYLSYACSDDHRGFGFAPRPLGFLAHLGIRLEISVMT